MFSKNALHWLREQGFDNNKVVECIEAVEGKKKTKRKKKIKNESGTCHRSFSYENLPRKGTLEK